MSPIDEPFSGRGLAPLQRTLSEDALERLARKVVDRLAMGARDLKSPRDLDRPDVVEIARLTNALLAERESLSNDYMLRLQSGGVTLDVLYARYLAPAAAKLGELWANDKLSFLQVTLGITRIFGLMRELRMNLPTPRITRADPVLFASVPGEQHTMGVEMAVQLFRQRGWDVKLLVGASEDEILAEIGKVQCLVLGLSSAGRTTAEAMAHLIFMVRAAHPEVHIIVSGQIVTEEPELVELMHADSAVATVEDALAMMDQLSEKSAAL